MIDFLLAVVAVGAAIAGVGLVAAAANALGFWRALADLPPVFVPVGLVGAAYGSYVVLHRQGSFDVNDAVLTVIGGFGTAVGAASIAVFLGGAIGLGVRAAWRRVRRASQESPPHRTQ